MTNLLPLMVAIPLAAGFVLALIPRTGTRTCNAVACGASAAILVIALLLFGKTDAYQMGGWEIPIGINLSLDGLSWLMLIIIAVVGFAVTLFSFAYMDTYTSKNRYYCILMLMVAGMNGTALSGDIFNRFVYVEIAVIASYILVGFGCEADELEAALKYAVLGAIASALTLFGVAILYALYGTVNIAHLAEKISSGPPVAAAASSVFFAAVVMLAGFTYKSAAVPLHIWQPDAFSTAPATVSAALSGALIQIVGIYAMIRTMFIVFGITASIGWILLCIGMLSMAFGAVAGAKQSELRRMLSYHSISQIGYILAGLGIGSIVIASGEDSPVAALAIIGALFHMVNHAVFQPLLFLTAGSIESSTKIRQIKNLAGVARKKPLTSAASLIASCSIAGVPPFGGFFSKMMIIIASALAGYYLIAITVVAISIVTLVAFMRFQYKMFFGQEIEPAKIEKKTPISMKVAMAALSVICIATSLLAIPAVRSAVLEPAKEAIVDRESYINRLNTDNQSTANPTNYKTETGK